VASVIGRQFSAEPLQVIADTPLQQTVLQLLADLSEAEMTRLITADPEWIYLFQHAMTHEVAYESLPYARRQQLHAAVASWLATKYQHNLKPLHPVLAYHYSRADNHSKALEFALLAADEARHIFANREAIDLYNLAERHLAALADESLWETAVHLYLSRGNVLILLGDLATAFADAENALALADENGDQGSTAVAYNLMAEIRYRQGAFDEVQVLTAKIIKELNSVAAKDQLARAYIWAGWTASSKLDYSVAMEYLEMAKQICQQENDNYLLARVYEAISFTRYSQKELELSLMAMQQGVELSREFSTPINVGIALSNVGFVQFTLGRYQEAVRTFNEAVQIGKESGKNLYALAMTNRAAAYSRLGNFESALADFEAAVDLLTTMNYPSLLVEAHLFWGFEYFCPLQRWQKAKGQFEQAQSLIDLQPESYIEEMARLLIGLGQVEIFSGSLSTAKKYLREAHKLIDEKELIWWQPIVEYFLGIACKNQDNLTHAESYFQSSLISAKEGCPDFNALAYLSLAELETNLQKREELLEKSVLTAKNRSRFGDKLVCFQRAGHLLSESKNGRLKKLGEECLASVNKAGFVLS
jgi:tetratricopeptide (TPR) repeat protein